MDIRTLGLVTFTCAVLYLHGCATTTGTTAAATGTAGENIPVADPAFDHYIAWIPRDRAPNSTVAKALTHITLGKAKEEAARQLCGGAWLLDGRVIDRVGPLPAIAPAASGGYPAWYYRVSHQPGLRGCSNATDVELYQSLGAHLPGWLSIQAAETPAGTSISRLE
jgi:hypothetical protein